MNILILDLGKNQLALGIFLESLFMIFQKYFKSMVVCGFDSHQADERLCNELGFGIIADFYLNQYNL
jgi:hypothetical protein